MDGGLKLIERDMKKGPTGRGQTHKACHRLFIVDRNRNVRSLEGPNITGADVI